MKKALVVLIIVIHAVLVSSQVDTVIIKGQIHSGDIKKVKIEWLKDNPIYDIQKTYTSPVNDNGQFELRIPISSIANGRIKAGKFTHYISLLPSDNFFVDIDADTIKYTGKGAEKNNFLYFIEKKGYSEENYYSDYNAGELPLDEFAIKLANYRDKQSELLYEYINYSKTVKGKAMIENQPSIELNEIEKEFIDYYIADISAIYMNLLMDYPEMYSYRNKVSENTLELPSEYKLNNLFDNVMDDNLVISDTYINMMSNFCVRKHFELIRSKGLKNIKQKGLYNTVLFDSLNGKTQEYVLAYKLCQNFARDKLDTIIFKKFKEIVKDSIAYNTVRKSYNHYNRKITLLHQPLVNEFNETLIEDTLGNMITFEEMLNKYTGKVVYLDIWGIRCGPCIGLMPATMKLKNELIDHPIEIVYLSHDHKYKNFWSDALKVTQTGENHYRLKNGFNAKLMQFMEINWVPYFMIFNKEGELVEFAASQPGDTNIKNKLLSIANEK